MKYEAVASNHRSPRFVLLRCLVNKFNVAFAADVRSELLMP